MAATKTVAVKPRAFEYANYAQFKEAVMIGNPSALIRQALTHKPSLSHYIPQTAFTDLTPLGVEKSLNEIFRSAMGNWRYDNKDSASTIALENQMNLVADLTALINGLRERGIVDTRGVNSVKNFLASLQAGHNGGAAELWWVGKRLPVVLGNVFEDIIVAMLNDPNIVGSLLEADLAKQLHEPNIRVTKEYNENTKKAYYKGTRLVDIEATATSAGTRFKISAKATPSRKDPLSFHVLSTTLQKLISRLNGDERIQYGFYRLFGYGAGVEQEVKNYLILKNLKEIFVGTGADQITDIILNDKIIPIDVLLNQIAANYSKDIFTMKGLTALNIGLPTTKRATETYEKAGLTTQRDKAIRTWIEGANLRAVESIPASISLNIANLKL